MNLIQDIIFNKLKNYYFILKQKKILLTNLIYNKVKYLVKVHLVKLKNAKVN